MAAEKRQRRRNTVGSKRALTRGRDWTAAYLRAFEETGVQQLACAAALVHRDTVHQRRTKDLEFAQAEDLVKCRVVGRLKKEAFRRAVEGLVQKKFTKSGEPIKDPKTGQQYFERVYSDQLMAKLLDAYCPEEFRPKQEVDLTSGGQPVKVLIGVNPDDV